MACLYHSISRSQVDIGITCSFSFGVILSPTKEQMGEGDWTEWDLGNQGLWENPVEQRIPQTPTKPEYSSGRGPIWGLAL